MVITRWSLLSHVALPLLKEIRVPLIWAFKFFSGANVLEHVHLSFHFISHTHCSSFQEEILKSIWSEACSRTYAYSRSQLGEFYRFFHVSPLFQKIRIHDVQGTLRINAFLLYTNVFDSYKANDFNLNSFITFKSSFHALKSVCASLIYILFFVKMYEA